MSKENNEKYLSEFFEILFKDIDWTKALYLNYAPEFHLFDFPKPKVNELSYLNSNEIDKLTANYELILGNLPFSRKIVKLNDVKLQERWKFILDGLKKLSSIGQAFFTTIPSDY